MPAEPPEPIECEIRARHAAHAAVLAEIAVTCARDLGQPLRPRTVRIGQHDPAASANDEAALTLHLPAALAGSQHQIWCLACRLACFLPSARVSVLIEAAAAFRPSPHSRALKTRRSA